MATVDGDVDDGFGRVADAFATNFTDHCDVGAACALVDSASGSAAPVGAGGSSSRNVTSVAWK